jgi:hypothetical protein
MNPPKATKFYVRHREGYPETTLQDSARRGFWELGIETNPYEWIDDIDSIEDLGPTVGVAGYIGDVHRALTKLGKPIPPVVDYPTPLEKFLERKLFKGLLEDVRQSHYPWFIKPLEHKLFSGLLWLPNDPESRRKTVTLADDVEIWISEPVNFVSEYRSFILDHAILDCRHYKGDWAKAPDRSTVEEAVQLMKGTAPTAYSLDWGVTDSGKTLLVEMNEGYSLGTYGLNPVFYARMLSARWFEMTS